jgi:DNA-binding NarL/FixJ family response regulator
MSAIRIVRRVMLVEAVLDLALPDGDGRDLIGELRRRHSGISILVLSVMLGPSHLDEVLKAGADAVLHKVASPRQS